MLIPKKYHIHIIALIAVAAIIFFPHFEKQPDPDALKRGTAAAEAFLKLVDDGHYVEAREAASPLLKEKIVPEVWKRQIPAMRDKVGALLQRSQESAAASDRAEDAPEGKYLTLKYASSFKRQKQATETLILALDADGQWRVAGYFIK